MIDTDFERRSALLTNEGYFDRVRELCMAGSSVKDAWIQVEKELPFGLRRFEHYGLILRVNNDADNAEIRIIRIVNNTNHTSPYLTTPHPTKPNPLASPDHTTPHPTKPNRTH
jgi:hypothetical protein